MTDTTGTAVLRATLTARFSKGPAPVALLARDLNIGTGALDAFAHGTGKLPLETLQALAKILFDATYDTELDRLRPVKKPEPASLGAGPPPITQMMTLPTFKAGPPQTAHRPLVNHHHKRKPNAPAGWSSQIDGAAPVVYCARLAV
jgi:hypothetical protein